jgi:hypothetical protein
MACGAAMGVLTAIKADSLPLPPTQAHSSPDNN